MNVRLEGLCVLTRVDWDYVLAVVYYLTPDNIRIAIGFKTRNAMKKTRNEIPTNYGHVASPILLKSVFGLE